jgi:hypothetical protein
MLRLKCAEVLHPGTSYKQEDGRHDWLEYVLGLQVVRYPPT